MIKRKIAMVVMAAFLVACAGEDTSSDLTTDIINNPTSASSEASEEDEGPYFEFEEEVKEFGTITQGESVSMTFRFKNVGKSNLIISSAQGSCGCTVPEWPKEPIAPGEEGKIEVTFNSTGKQGLQSKTITLVANTIPNTKVIAVKGEVLAPTTE